MQYLVDTNILISYSKKQVSVVSSLITLIKNDNELGVCAINITEFYSGISAEIYTFWDEFFTSLYYWELTPSVAKKAGQYRYDFARKGITLSTADALIAAAAWENNAIVLTTNVKDFPMKDIRVLSF